MMANASYSLLSANPFVIPKTVNEILSYCIAG